MSLLIPPASSTTTSNTYQVGPDVYATTSGNGAESQIPRSNDAYRHLVMGESRCYWTCHLFTTLNIFYLNTEQVLLNDWGSSVTTGEAVLYAGAPEPHIHPEIEMTDLYSPVAKHDLHALVSSFVLLLSPGVNVGSRKLLFKEAFEAAETCDYAGIALNLTSHMK